MRPRRADGPLVAVTPTGAPDAGGILRLIAGTARPAPAPRLPARTRLAATVGGTVGGLSRRLGRGGGSVVGGRAILALDPAALHRLAAGRRSVLVSGTNGKTTTTSLLRAALGTLGPVATNLLGANLPSGLAAALAGGPPGGLAALEVDEAWLGRVVVATDPQVVVLLNLTRDQLDRNNEVRTLATAWRTTLAERPGTVVVANADDPLVAWGAGAAARVCWVGAGQPWTADASGCPACGGAIRFGAAEGAWRCEQCALGRPALDVRIDGHAVRDADGAVTTIELALPGRANLANAAMALAAARCLGADPGAAATAMAATTEVVGRYRTVDVHGVQARLLLAKNPAGWLEVLDMLGAPPAPVVVVINARIADGKDPSWLWDVPFERLGGRLVVATGERGRDLAVRLHYADVGHRYVADPLDAVVVAAGEARRLGLDHLDVVANYTSFQVLRARLP